MTIIDRQTDLAAALTDGQQVRPRFAAIFLDRDGVINENRVDHVKSWAEFNFLPGAIEAIVRLSRAGFRLFVVSNQAIVNRGVVSAAEVDAINRAMVGAIEQAGGRIDDVAYCPHRPDEACGCRKPEPGLLLALGLAYGLDLTDSLLIGDALSDLKAGQAAGCTTVLVMTGRGRDQLSEAIATNYPRVRVARDLAAVADVLVGAGVRT